MRNALFVLAFGIILISLILGAISPIQNLFTQNNQRPTPETATSEPAEVIVRSDFSQANTSVEANVGDSNQEDSGLSELLDSHARMQVLLGEEPSLTGIIEENIQLIGNIEHHAAFQHHQTILKLIQDAANVQPISVVCTGTICNLAIYANSAERAEEFVAKLIQPSPQLPIDSAEVRPFKEEEHNLVHVVLFMKPVTERPN
ncbi:MAG: hypothetical protein LAT77_07050 [Aliidiomarina sp.]|uniref:hypothetical protein n=1 Tax=Aliidiomarina sp. TaxID=1872439 RepID=UPI0025C5B51B|nr:hypothetical protein [Aliidiomarina sp.]MCH8501654.1 hypothetical protein [Aliidiomarina sp.]